MNMMSNDNKKILIVTYGMIPYCNNWGTCQRIYFLAEQFTEEGYQTWVVASKQTSESVNFGKKISFKQIFINSVFINSQDNFISKKSNSDKSYFLNTIKKRLLNFIYCIEKIIFNEPISKIGITGLIWSIKANKTIKTLIKRENIETVIISSPPFSFLFTSYFLRKQFNNLKIILDYRDPWNLWNGGSLISNFLEKKIIKSATYITVTNDNSKTDLSKLYSINRNKISVIYNGYSQKDWDTLPTVKKTIRTEVIISYIGSISFNNDSYRNITQFFKAYDLLENKNLFKIKFIGVTFNSELDKYKKKYPEIEMIGKVSPHESYNYMLESDVLMNIHTTNDNSGYYLIGGKIYDYLKSEKTIFSINSENSFEQTFLKTLGNVVCSKNNHLDILKSFNLIYEKLRFSKNHKKYDINQYSREYQNNKFIRIVNNLIDA